MLDCSVNSFTRYQVLTPAYLKLVNQDGDGVELILVSLTFHGGSCRISGLEKWHVFAGGVCGCPGWRLRVRRGAEPPKARMTVSVVAIGTAFPAKES